MHVPRSTTLHVVHVWDGQGREEEGQLLLPSTHHSLPMSATSSSPPNLAAVCEQVEFYFSGISVPPLSLPSPPLFSLFPLASSFVRKHNTMG